MKKPVRREDPRETFLIESLEILVEGIAKTFGSRCEVVLHDLRKPSSLDRSIVKIENGHITGRTVGGSITDHGLRFLKSGRDDNIISNYQSSTKDGRILKSSTFIFRNENREPVAAICINFDLSDIMTLNIALQDIFKVSEDQKVQNDLPETFQGDIVSTLGEMANETIRRTGKIVPSMNKNDKIEIVRKLENQGFFLIKGSVKLIASKLNLSKYTIYNYLEQIRTNQLDPKVSRV
jgi:predicted transcriptional regulator YheO